jgi:hypothetical protein
MNESSESIRAFEFDEGYDDAAFKFAERTTADKGRRKEGNSHEPLIHPASKRS